MVASLVSRISPVKRKSCQGMVEVYLHVIIGDFHHFSREAVAVFVLQGYLRSYEHVVVVEVSILAESFPGYVHDMFLCPFPVCFLGCQDELESFPFCHVYQVLLKLGQHHPHATDEDKRVVGSSLLQEPGLSVGYVI